MTGIQACSASETLQGSCYTGLSSCYKKGIFLVCFSFLTEFKAIFKSHCLEYFSALGSSTCEEF